MSKSKVFKAMAAIFAVGGSAIAIKLFCDKKQKPIVIKEPESVTLRIYFRDGKIHLKKRIATIEQLLQEKKEIGVNEFQKLFSPVVVGEPVSVKLYIYFGGFEMDTEQRIAEITKIIRENDEKIGVHGFYVMITE